MLSFKEFLLEKKYLTGQVSKEWELILQGDIPLRPSKNKTEEHIKISYHVTSVLGVKNLLKYQNKRNQISSFTRGSKWLAYGAKETGEIILELEGYSYFKGHNDLYSTLSRNGYRWLKYNLTPTTLKISKKIKEEIKKYLLKETPLSKDPNIAKTVNLDDYYTIKMFFDSWGGKEKGKLVSWFLDNMDKWITKKDLEKIKEETKDLDEESSDEVVLHNYKIKKGWYIKKPHQSIPCLEDDYDCLSEDYNLKNCGIVDIEEISKINVDKNIILKCKI